MTDEYIKRVKESIDSFNEDLAPRHMKIYWTYDYDLNLFQFLLEAYRGYLFKRIWLAPYDHDSRFITVPELHRQISEIIKEGIVVRKGGAV